MEPFRNRGYLRLYVIFGLNSIFINLFFEIANPLIGYVRIPVHAALIFGSLVGFKLEAGLMYFLYKRKIFFEF
jgi:hypothetical protein